MFGRFLNYCISVETKTVTLVRLLNWECKSDAGKFSTSLVYHKDSYNLSDWAIGMVFLHKKSWNTDSHYVFITITTNGILSRSLSCSHVRDECSLACIQTCIIKVHVHIYICLKRWKWKPLRIHQIDDYICWINGFKRPLMKIRGSMG